MLSRRSASRPMYLCVAVFFARYWSARHNCMIGLWFFSGQKDKIELYPRRDTHLRAAAPNKMLYLVILRKAPKFNDLWRVIICPCLGCHVWLTYIHAFVSYLADWRTHRHMHRQTHTHTHLYVPTIHCGESALWGKFVRPSWSLWGTYTHTYKWYIVGKVHCGENPWVLVGRCGERTHRHTLTDALQTQTQTHTDPQR